MVINHKMLSMIFTRFIVFLISYMLFVRSLLWLVGTGSSALAGWCVGNPRGTFLGKQWKKARQHITNCFKINFVVKFQESYFVNLLTSFKSIMFRAHPHFWCSYHSHSFPRLAHFSLRCTSCGGCTTNASKESLEPITTMEDLGVQNLWMW